MNDCARKQGIATQTNTDRGGRSNPTGIGAQIKDLRTVTAASKTTTIETTETTTQKWVKNEPGVPLTQAQALLLTHGPGFEVTPRHPPYGDCIVAIEQVCSIMEPNNAGELRAEIRGVLKHPHPPGVTSVGKKSRLLWNIGQMLQGSS